MSSNTDDREGRRREKEEGEGGGGRRKEEEAGKGGGSEEKGRVTIDDTAECCMGLSIITGREGLMITLGRGVNIRLRDG